MLRKDIVRTLLAAKALVSALVLIGLSSPIGARGPIALPQGPLGAGPFTIGSGGNLQLFAGVNNVFDQDPPIAASEFISNWSSNPAVYNLIGRNYYGGVRFDF